MDKETIKTKIKDSASNGKLPCPVAFRLAEQLGISKQDLGELLNELGIKLIQCQLGCF